MTYDISRHADRRIRQRGYRDDDVTVILKHGTPTHDGVVLREKDAAELIGECRRRIAALERLKGSAVFLADGTVVSVYRPSRTRVRRMIRDGRGRVSGSATGRRGRRAS